MPAFVIFHDATLEAIAAARPQTLDDLRGISGIGATKLQRYGKVSRGHLGVAIQELNQSLAESFGLKRADGALVASVGAGTPAEKAGLQAGDVIVGFNGRPIANSAELPLAVADVRPGEAARIRVWRKGNVRDLTVVVGEAPEQRVAARVQR